MSKEKPPKVVYAVYNTDGYFDDIAFVTAYKSNAIEFILQRNSDPRYKLLTIDKKEHAKRVWEYAYEHSLFGELVGDLIFTDGEYQYLSESYIQLVQDLSYTLEDKLTNGTGGYKVMTAEYADNVPVISTNISTDAESDIKTTSPKAVKSYVDTITGNINTILDTINGEVI